MKINEYGEYLQGRNITPDKIAQQQTIIGDLVSFLTEAGLKETAAVKKEVEMFAQKLIADGRNTPENFSALCSYADWLGHRTLYTALIEMTDCHNAMAVLAGKIEKRHGREMRSRIFCESLPPLGAGEKERSDYTRIITERMARQIDLAERSAVWFQVQHGIPAEDWRSNDMADREKYLRCASIDEFLNLKRQERDTMLTRLRDEDKLWYTLVINDETLEYIKSDPAMEVGQREGGRIYITKVPYNITRYIHETDTKMKRYYACHCPLVREAILHDLPVSPDVCECSLGHASHYLAGLNREIKGEVLESAVRGDTRCRFVFYITE